MKSTLSVRMLAVEDAPAFVDHLVRNAPSPGVRSPPISDPFPSSQKIDAAAYLKSAQRRWLIPAGEPGWGRAWGVFANSSFEKDFLVGEVTLSTSRLIETQMHRAILGMGIEPSYRGNGLGTEMLKTALSWAKEQHFLAWVDLGVFAHNAPARRLYANFGFQEIGRCVDCFRVDDVRVDDIQMTLDLSQYTPR